MNPYTAVQLSSYDFLPSRKIIQLEQERERIRVLCNPRAISVDMIEFSCVIQTLRSIYDSGGNINAVIIRAQSVPIEYEMKCEIINIYPSAYNLIAHSDLRIPSDHIHLPQSRYSITARLKSPLYCGTPDDLSIKRLLQGSHAGTELSPAHSPLDVC